MPCYKKCFTTCIENDQKCDVKSIFIIQYIYQNKISKTMGRDKKGLFSTVGSICVREKKFKMIKE